MISANFSKKTEIIVLTLILVFTVFFATFKLSESPSVWYDEGFYVQSALNLASSGQSGLHIIPEKIEQISQITVGYPLIYPLALALKVFGENIVVTRGLMVIFILALLVGVYFLVRKLYGSYYALGSLLLLVTFPPLYGNGKSVLGEVPGLFYLVAFLLSLYFARNKAQGSFGRVSLLVLSGLLAGLCASTKPVFLLILPAILLGLFIYRKSKIFSIKEIFLTSIAVLIPLLVWFALQFTTSDSFGGILGFYANPYAVTSVASTIFSSLKAFFSSSGPIYLLVLLVVWIFALCIKLRQKSTIQIEETVAFIFSILITLAYFRTAGWYRYIFQAQIIAIIFFLPSLFIFLQWLIEKTKFGFVSTKTLATIGLILLSVLGTYQLAFHSWVADYYTSQKSAFWDDYFKKEPKDESLLIYNAPEVAIFAEFNGKSFYQYLAPAGGVWGEDNLKLVESGWIDKVIVRTDVYSGEESFLFKNYISVGEFYKYTVLQTK
ncbi:MAG: glycosyltransferase family 39 protein [Parcubacteria group bacterium]|nr:glycosyltransferase family 39 protein [Parcubacteria group bacterium]